MMLKWFTTHDREKHFWVGLFLSIVLLISLSGIQSEYKLAFWIIAPIAVVARGWELWRKKPRTVNLGFWKTELPASMPDWNDVWATLAGGAIIPAFLVLAKIIFGT